MSYWIDIQENDISLSENKEEIHIWYKSDCNGNCYISVKTKDMLDFIKKERLTDEKN